MYFSLHVPMLRLFPAVLYLVLTCAREQDVEDMVIVHDSPADAMNDSPDGALDPYANDDKLPCDYCKNWSVTRRNEADLKPGEWLEKYGVSVSPAICLHVTLHRFSFTPAPWPATGGGASRAFVLLLGYGCLPAAIQYHVSEIKEHLSDLP